MKKTIATLLMIIMILSMCMMSVMASETPAYTLSGPTTVTSGDEFSVSVNISENPGIISLRLTVSYDMEVLELKEVSDSRLLNGYTQPSPTISSPYTLRWSDALATENNTSNGTIVILTFLAKKPIDNTTITISHLESRNQIGEKVSFSNVDMKISIICEHTYGDWEKYNETQHQRVCSKCGNVEYAVHTWDEGKITTEPTCKDTGIKTYTCTACGETKTEVVPVTDEHTWGDWEKDDESNHKHTCEICGKEETAVHTWDEGKITTEPTCKDTGIKTYTCTACGETKTEAVPVTDEHTWGDWEKYNAEEHKHTCEICGKEETAAHTWDEGKITTEPTCKDTGIKTYTCTACGGTKIEVVPVTDEHTWGDWEKYNAEEHKHTCEICGKEETAAHTWDEGKITTEPTCKDTGIKTYTCTACVETKTEVVPVTDKHTWGDWEKYNAEEHKHTCEVCGKEETAAHTWDEGELTLEPSGGKEGEKTYTCTACGETKTEVVPPNHVHSYSEEWHYDGTMHWHVCSCGGKKDTGAHRWDEGVIQKTATCTEEGSILYTCTVCGATKTVNIIGEHVAGEWTVVKEATCTEAGKEARICTICGAILEEREIAAKGHTAGAWEEESGERVQKCTVCGEVLVREPIQTEETSSTESTALTEPTESTEPIDTTEPVSTSDSDSLGIVFGIVMAVIGVIAIVIVVIIALKKKSKTVTK